MRWNVFSAFCPSSSDYILTLEYMFLIPSFDIFEWINSFNVNIIINLSCQFFSPASPQGLKPAHVKKGGLSLQVQKDKVHVRAFECVCALRRWKLARSHVIPTASPHQEALRNYRDAARSNGVPPQSHYLEGFSLSRRYGGRSGVKLRCKERLASIGCLSHPPFTISLQSYTAKAEGGGLL